MFRQLRKEGLVSVILLMLLFLGPSIIQAQDFPTKPVTLEHEAHKELSKQFKK